MITTIDTELEIEDQNAQQYFTVVNPIWNNVWIKHGFDFKLVWLFFSFSLVNEKFILHITLNLIILFGNMSLKIIQLSIPYGIFTFNFIQVLRDFSSYNIRYLITAALLHSNNLSEHIKYRNPLLLHDSKLIHTFRCHPVQRTNTIWK